MAVVHGGVGEVVGEREEEDGGEVGKVLAVVVLAPAVQAAEHKEAEEKVEGDAGEVEGLVVEVGGGEGPEAGPEAEDAAGGGGGNEGGVVGGEVEGQGAFLGEVGDFAHLNIFLEFDWVGGGVGEGGIGFGGVAVVAGVEL